MPRRGLGLGLGRRRGGGGAVDPGVLALSWDGHAGETLADVKTFAVVIDPEAFDIPEFSIAAVAVRFYGTGRRVGIGRQAASGDVYDADSLQEITFNSSSHVVQAGDASTLSDVIPFEWNGTDKIIFSYEAWPDDEVGANDDTVNEISTYEAAYNQGLTADKNNDYTVSGLIAGHLAGLGEVYFYESDAGAEWHPSVLFQNGEDGAIFDGTRSGSATTNGTLPCVPPFGLDCNGLRDTSGNGNTLFTPSGFEHPTFTVAGDQQYLEFASASSDSVRTSFTCDQPYTRVAAWRRTSGTGLTNVFGSAAGASGGQLQITAGGNLQAGSASFFGSIPYTNNTDVVTTERIDGAASSLAADNGAYVTGDAGAVNPTGMRINGDGSGSNQGNIRFYRAIFIDRILTDDEITLARAWCAKGAGVTL